jgi:hypothetical protein
MFARVATGKCTKINKFGLDLDGWQVLSQIEHSTHLIV